MCPRVATKCMSVVPQDVPQLQLAAAAAEALPRTGGGLQQLSWPATGRAALTDRLRSHSTGVAFKFYEAVLLSAIPVKRPLWTCFVLLGGL